MQGSIFNNRKVIEIGLTDHSNMSNCNWQIVIAIHKKFSRFWREEVIVHAIVLYKEVCSLLWKSYYGHS